MALVLPCHIREVGTKALRGHPGANCDKPSISAKSSWESMALRASGNAARRATFFLSCAKADPPMERRTAYAGTHANTRRRGAKRRERAGRGGTFGFALATCLASEKARMVALHDCDIVTYDRELLARLCYPVAHPAMGFGLLQRLLRARSDRLNGRVMRLFITRCSGRSGAFGTAIRSWCTWTTFRYPLAGEMAMDTDLVRRVRIPHDWALRSACWRRSSATRATRKLPV